MNMGDPIQLKRKSETSVDSKFGAGAVVVLRSGGPAMTVREMIKSGQKDTLRVDWFDSENDLKTADFLEIQLMRFETLDADEQAILDDAAAALNDAAIP